MEGPSFADGERFIVLLHKVVHACEGAVPWAVEFAEVASKLGYGAQRQGKGKATLESMRLWHLPTHSSFG